MLIPNGGLRKFGAPAATAFTAPAAGNAAACVAGVKCVYNLSILSLNVPVRNGS
jgi:hypothetical protein